MEQWTEVLYPEGFYYFIYSLGFYTQETLKAFKQWDLIIVFTLGLFRSCFIWRLTCSWKLSQRVSNKPHECRTCLERNGVFICACCRYKAEISLDTDKYYRMLLQISKTLVLPQNYTKPLHGILQHNKALSLLLGTKSFSIPYILASLKYVTVFICKNIYFRCKSNQETVKLPPQIEILKSPWLVVFFTKIIILYLLTNLTSALF